MGEDRQKIKGLDDVYFNPLELLCVVLGTNPRLTKEIDKLYNKNKWEYYKVGKTSFEDSILFGRMTLVKDDYIRKTAGIIMYEFERESSDAMFTLIKKGYKSLFFYVQTRKSISLDDYYFSYVKKNGGLEKIKELDLMNECIVLQCFAPLLGKKVKHDSPVGDLINSHIFKLYYDAKAKDPSFYMTYFKDSYSQIGKYYEKYNLPKKNNLDIMLFMENEILKVVDSRIMKYPDNSVSMDILRTVRQKVFTEGIFKHLGSYSAILKTSGYDEDTFFQDFTLSKSDMELILTELATSKKENNLNEEEVDQLFIAIIFIRAILHEYTKAKEYALETQQDSFYEEVVKQSEKLQEKEQQLLRKESDYKKEQASHSAKIVRQQSLIDSLGKEVKQLKSKQVEVESNQKELIALRAFAFRSSKHVNYSDVVEDPISKLKGVKGAVFGGHVNWHNKLKLKLSHFRFISPESLNLDFSFVRNLDVAYVNTSYANHALYRKLMKELERCDTQLVFLDTTNDDITYKEMVTTLE